jgi:hypothetical protein
MIRTQYTKYSALCGILLIITIMLNTTEGSQKVALAQITPAPEKAGGSNNDDAADLSSNSSPDTGNGNAGDDGSSDSLSDSNFNEGEDSVDPPSNEDSSDPPGENDINGSGQSTAEEDSTEEDSSDPSGENDMNDSGGNGQSTTEQQQDNELTASEKTNPLLDSIMDKVTRDLSAAGIADIGFQ